MILLSHPFVNGRVRHTATALSRAGVLGEFWTYSDRTPSLQRIPPAAIARPSADPSPDAPPCDGAADAGASSLAMSLDEAMSVRLDMEMFRAVYAYGGGANVTFQTARRRGVVRIYDLIHGLAPGPHPILDEEAELEPEWAATLHPPGFGPVQAERFDAELKQADLILVGSTFGLSTLEQTADLPASMAVVVPGAPQPPEPIKTAAVTSRDQLRVLFCGPLGQRSGLSYLFRACRELGRSVSLTVIGAPPPVNCPALANELARVRWLPTCAQEVIRREMAAHDVFLFPSVFDSGSAGLLDALSMGLPIVATEHSAAPDLISDGREGLIVPARSTARIVDSLDRLRDPGLRAQMSLNARQRAATHSWARFEQIIAATVASAIGVH